MIDLLTLTPGTCLLDSEEKMQKALDDLYPVASKLKGYKDQTRWSERSHVSEVLHYVLMQAFGIARKEESGLWVIDENGTYRFKIKTPVYFHDEMPVVPVWYIPELKGHSYQLYSLVFYMVVFILHNRGVQSWDEDNCNYMYDDMKSKIDHYLQRSDDKEAEEYKRLRDNWQEHEKGSAHNFLKLLIRSGASKKKWMQAFEEYKPVTRLEKEFYQWLLLGKKIIETNDTLYNYISLPPGMSQEEAENGEVGITADQYVKFVWRMDDPWWEMYADYHQSISYNEGSLPCFEDRVLTEETVGLSGEKRSDFIYTLIDWLDLGKEIENSNRKLLSDPKKLRKALDKSKKLIDIL